MNDIKTKLVVRGVPIVIYENGVCAMDVTVARSDNPRGLAACILKYLFAEGFIEWKQ